MTDEDFDNYLNEAIDELDEKHASLISEYDIGGHSEFVVDYEKQLLTFFENEKPFLEAKIIPIAHHDSGSGKFVWFWANQELPEQLRKKGEPIKAIYKITEAEIFVEDSLECGETMVWEIAALVCKGFDSIGVFCVPEDNLNSYVLIEEIKEL